MLLLLVSLSGCGTAPVACLDKCQADQRRLAYVEANSNLDLRLKKAILSGKVIIGMSKEDVIAAIGEPDNSVDNNASWVGREQWVYTEDASHRGYYFFKYGRLNSWNLATR
jgi:hypothetical protein